MLEMLYRSYRFKLPLIIDHFCVYVCVPSLLSNHPKLRKISFNTMMITSS